PSGMRGGQWDDDVGAPSVVSHLPGVRRLILLYNSQRPTIRLVIPERQLLRHGATTAKAEKVQRWTLGRGFRGFLLDAHRRGESVCRFAYLAAFLALRRSSGWRSRFRIRKLFGVTSTSSSGPIYSKANSRDISWGGVKIKASSDPEARIFVRCFSLQTFTSR